MHYPLWGIILGYIIWSLIGSFFILLIISCFTGGKGNDSGDDGGGYGSF